MDALQQAIIALKNQDWGEALQLLKQTDHLDLDPAQRAEALRIRASAMTRRGLWRAAREDYFQLRRLYPDEQDIQLEVLCGLAECYEAVGDWHTAGHLIGAAVELAGNLDIERRLKHAEMILRIETLRLRLMSRVASSEARAGFRKLLGRSDLPQGSMLAATRFAYGELYWSQGEIKQALQQYDLSYTLAQNYGALITAADCMRRITLARLLDEDDVDWVYGVQELQQAESWYESAGDRTSGHIYTELGEIRRHLGMLHDSVREFERGITLMQHQNENVRLAHNYLGLAETHRLLGKRDQALAAIDVARALYRQLMHPWGIVMSTYVGALLGDPWPEGGDLMAEDMLQQLGDQELQIVTKKPMSTDQPLILRYVD